MFSPRMNCSLLLFPFISPSLSTDLLLSALVQLCLLAPISLSLLHPAGAGIPQQQEQGWGAQEPQLSIQMCPVSVFEGGMGRADSTAEFVVWAFQVNPESAQGKGKLKLKF